MLPQAKVVLLNVGALANHAGGPGNVHVIVAAIGYRM